MAPGSVKNHWRKAGQAHGEPVAVPVRAVVSVLVRQDPGVVRCARYRTAQARRKGAYRHRMSGPWRGVLEADGPALQILCHDGGLVAGLPALADQAGLPEAERNRAERAGPPGRGGERPAAALTAAGHPRSLHRHPQRAPNTSQMGGFTGTCAWIPCHLRGFHTPCVYRRGGRASAFRRHRDRHDHRAETRGVPLVSAAPVGLL